LVDLAQRAVNPARLATGVVVNRAELVAGDGTLRGWLQGLW